MHVLPQPSACSVHLYSSLSIGFADTVLMRIVGAKGPCFLYLVGEQSGAALHVFHAPYLYVRHVDFRFLDCRRRSMQSTRRLQISVVTDLSSETVSVECSPCDRYCIALLLFPCLCTMSRWACTNVHPQCEARAYAMYVWRAIRQDSKAGVCVTARIFPPVF